jgi:hypothetical protein
MSKLEKVIRRAPAGPAIAFRERAYGEVERHEFLRDILGLANALVDGPRFLIMGVRDGGPDERSFIGISADELSEAQELYQARISRLIEPVLKIDLQSLQLDDVAVAIIALHDCDEPPYLLQKDVSNEMRAGSGWIRRSTEPSRLQRADLQQLFAKTAPTPAATPTPTPAPAATPAPTPAATPAPAATPELELAPEPELAPAPEPELAPAPDPDGHPAIQVGFAGKVPLEEITLKVLDLSELPSVMASDRLRKLLHAKQASQDMTDTVAMRIERLVYAREFGGTQPFEQISENSLSRRLDANDEDHHDADEYYKYETRTHQVNISLENTGAADLCDGVLTLDFPHLDGLGVSEYIHVAPDSEAEPPGGYPTVETGERKIRVKSKIESVACGATVPAFSQPLRVWVREPLAGQTLPVDFALHAANLSEPIVGTLRLQVSDA